MGSPQRPHTRNIDGVDVRRGKGQEPVPVSTSDLGALSHSYLRAPVIADSNVDEILSNRVLGALLEAKNSPLFNEPRYNSVDIRIIKSDKFGESYLRLDTGFFGLIAKDQDICINENVLVNKSQDYTKLLVRKNMFAIKNNYFKMFSPLNPVNLASFVGFGSAGVASGVGMVLMGITNPSLVWGVIAGAFCVEHLVSVARHRNKERECFIGALNSLKGSVNKEEVIKDLESQKTSLLQKIFPTLFTNDSVKKQVSLANSLL